MPWIKQINENDATGKLSEVYDELKNARGKVSNIMKINSLDAITMKNHLDLYLSIMYNKTDANIDREEKELIAVVVSALNNCSY
ncbi:MAG: carboxymuconolactone decarboxylase family protein, partial [Ignavibacteriae bacterium]|nr:carboxymuconolactone decarboxylase family protein [Ignavibacteriota bacterium]